MHRLSLSAQELHRLYVRDRLSTYRIAERYGCDPKTIYRYLILNHIPTRPRKRITFSRKTLHRMYTLKHKSLSDIAKFGNYSAAGILKKLRLYGIKRRSISETSTKHPKQNFDGDRKEKAYLIGFRVGDLGVRDRQNLIYISTGTTKEAQSRLVQDLFGSYGPLWLSKIHGGAAINITCALNKSFSFLLPKYKNIPKWILRSPQAFFAFLAGYTDAEGNFQISNGMGKFRIRSCDIGILRDIHRALQARGICSIHAIDRRAGTDKRGARLNNDCWIVAVNDKSMLFRLLTILLPLLRHAKRKEDAAMVFANVTNRLDLHSKKRDSL